ncbi:hypothetical protein BDV95DRAFT_54627 [Massariosphaeria phaeospora]|uniref:Uncharacterized protein n=1 Tax=Massariosphaeria phaeospora TaxID=100035 RepID=A0A7C8M7U2_9PLEO|nr:hypothetical protein BDV95DRAFT_54627 [Massariosphaeria phaeospora]
MCTIGSNIFALRPGDMKISDLFRDPTVQACSLPTGNIFYFALPVPTASLNRLNLDDLKQLYHYIQGNVNLVSRVGGVRAVSHLFELQRHLEQLFRIYKVPCPTPLCMTIMDGEADSDFSGQRDLANWINGGFQGRCPAPYDPRHAPNRSVTVGPTSSLSPDEIQEFLDRVPDSIVDMIAVGDASVRIGPNGPVDRRATDRFNDAQSPSPHRHSAGSDLYVEASSSQAAQPRGDRINNPRHAVRHPSSSPTSSDYDSTGAYLGPRGHFPSTSTEAAELWQAHLRRHPFPAAFDHMMFDHRLGHAARRHSPSSSQHTPIPGARTGSRKYPCDYFKPATETRNASIWNSGGGAFNYMFGGSPLTSDVARDSSPTYDHSHRTYSSSTAGANHPRHHPRRPRSPSSLRFPAHFRRTSPGPVTRPHVDSTSARHHVETGPRRSARSPTHNRGDVPSANRPGRHHHQQGGRPANVVQADHHSRRPAPVQPVRPSEGSNRMPVRGDHPTKPDSCLQPGHCCNPQSGAPANIAQPENGRRSPFSRHHVRSATATRQQRGMPLPRAHVTHHPAAPPTSVPVGSSLESGSRAPSDTQVDNLGPASPREECPWEEQCSLDECGLEKCALEDTGHQVDLAFERLQNSLFARIDALRPDVAASDTALHTSPPAGRATPRAPSVERDAAASSAAPRASPAERNLAASVRDASPESEIE